MSRPGSRQELYDRIRESSKDDVILEEMIRYGFYTGSDEGEEQSESAAEVARIAELQQMVRSLATEASRLRNMEAMQKEARRRRMAEARARREETKARREAERTERRRAWEIKKEQEIVYLGAGVSGALGQHEGSPATGLPSVVDARSLAQAIGISVGELRWLAFHRRVSRTTHYRRFQIPKKTGGHRLISAPMPRLKATQTWIRTAILEQIEVHPAAHGFVRGRSIVSNASAHTGQHVVINLDLKGFFPTVTYPRVWGLFRSLGFSPEVCTILSLLATEAEVDELELDERVWYVHHSERHLPQGAPCSPGITNLLCRKLDRRLGGLAQTLGFVYTRYADDLTFSSAQRTAPVNRVIRAVHRIVEEEGFTIHPDKTRIMHRGRRQEVTGLVVNDRVSVPRRLLKQWRATLFQVRKDGPQGKKFGLGDDVLGALQGFAAFVQMVDEARGSAMLAEAREVARQHRWVPVPRPERRTPPKKAAEKPAGDVPSVTRAAKPSQTRWWEFWKWKI